MSKSMAIEGVMKIFLMVAVIIVALSFLLRAFDIDILGWLKDKFEGDILPPEGKAIHMKLDPDDNPIEIWEFHLLSTTQSMHHRTEKLEDKGPFKVFPGPTTFDMFFFPDRSLFEGDLASKCVVFASDEGDGIDKGGFYYVSDGSTIQVSGTCKSPYSCLINPIRESVPLQVKEGEGDKCVEGNPTAGCNGDVNCGGRSHFVNCAGGNIGPCLLCGGKATESAIDDDDLLLKPFGKGKFKNECIENPSQCNLLGKNKKELETLKSTGSYSIKYGVICSSNGNWQVCNEKTIEETRTARALGRNIECRQTGDVFVWDEEQIKQAIAEINPPSLSLSFVPESQIQVKNVPVTITINAQDAGFGAGLSKIRFDVPSECRYGNTFVDFTGLPPEQLCSGTTCSTTLTMSCPQAKKYEGKINVVDISGIEANKVFTVEFK